MVEIVYLDPADGAELAADYPLSVSVRTPTADPFVRIVICIRYAALGFTELAYAQNPALSAQYEGKYATGGSTVTAVTDPGFHHYGFVIFREPFWPASPELLVYAFNDAGEELA